MKNVYWRKFVVLAAALAAVSVSAEAQERERGFLFQAGIAAAAINYGAEAEALFSSAASSGLTRLELGLDLEAGWAVGRDLYVVAAAHGVATRFYDSYGDYLQINSYLFGPGVRVYPFHTGLVLGVDGGAARVVVDSNLGVYGVSPWGWAVAGCAAYDFNTNATGLGLILGIRVLYASIGTAGTTAGTAFVDIAWK